MATESQPQASPLPEMHEPLLADPTIAARFWVKVGKTATCWLWLASTANGYGVFWTNRNQQGQVYAHRYAYQLLVGAIPKELTIDHLCRNRVCVNPAHMEIVSRGINVLRGEGVTAQNARKTHCSKGHLFDASNTYYGPIGRDCRTCHRERQAKRLKEVPHAD